MFVSGYKEGPPEEMTNHSCEIFPAAQTYGENFTN